MLHRYKVRLSMKQNYKDFELEGRISISKWRIPGLQKKNWRTLQDFFGKTMVPLQSEESSETILFK